jgi:hypothetical protein
METRVKIEKAEKIKERIVPGWGWGFHNNYGSHRLGRIWVCWDKDCLEVKVVRSSHDQIITCDV